MSNTFTKFIDSCVGAIARKVQDEFDESKHPRDKGGKFSSKGGEGRGAGTSEYDGMDRDEMEQLRSEAMRKQEREKAGSDKFHEYQKQISELTKLINRAKKSEEDDDEGYMGLSKEELAEEEEYENARERARREKDDDRVTGPEDRDYMNEEDDDVVPSLEQYKKNVSENFDGDEEYEVEARYDRAKYHSDKFKKLQNGEYRGTPEEKYLKNYYRRLGIKKPEDAFKVWWDI